MAAKLKYIRDMFTGSTEVEEDFNAVDKDANKEKRAKPPTLRDIPKLTKSMLQGEPEEATDASKRLYELCDVAHKQNREPMVATGKYDVLNPLAECLLHDNDDKLHFVCLTLNNLAVPHDNKKVMSMERIRKKLFTNLCYVIAAGKREAYLCLICLTNLSYYEPAQINIGQFSPSQKDDKIRFRRSKTPPLENPNSLLRILQDTTAHAARGTADFRWAFGLLASLAKHPENAQLIGLTAIPRVAIENLTLSKTPSTEWKTNSLEDFSLFLILYLAEAKSHEALEGVIDVVEPIMTNDNGIQGLKATITCAYLQVPWSTFPNYGVVAAGSVSELMGNALERVGKKHSYENNVFSLKTAVTAYGSLARAAALADKEEGKNDGYSNSKVVALPTAVAILFQIISEIANHWGEEEEDDQAMDDIHWDLKAGELAVGALVALLPALLEREISPRSNSHTETACKELSQLLLLFAKKCSTLHSQSRTTEAAEAIWAASKFALPLLEASYDLWKHSSGRKL